MKYLLDTNICIFLKRGDDIIDRKIEEVSQKNCFVSEVTVAELKYGAEHSDRRDASMKKVNLLLARFEVIQITPSIDLYAIEQAKLKKIGKLLEKFDALIAATAVIHDLTLVTADLAFNRFQNLKIENWATHLSQKPPYLPQWKHQNPNSKPSTITSTPSLPT